MGTHADVIWMVHGERSGQRWESKLGRYCHVSTMHESKGHCGFDFDGRYEIEIAKGNLNCDYSKYLY